MKNEQKKLIFILSIVVAIFTIGIISKSFQNDTFFNIAIGKYINENGIDMKDHFSWVPDNLDYGYSHWAFDIITYIIYNNWGFTGIYISVIIFSIITSTTLFVLLSKRSNSPIIALLVTLISIYIVQGCFTARSQLISFLCFIIEIYCLEQFVETNKKRYALLLILQAIIIANFHAATWPLVLVLFLPYLVPPVLNKFSSKNIYSACIRSLEKKISKLPKESEKIKEYQKDIEYYKKIIDEPKGKYADYKIEYSSKYNFRNLIILMLIVALTGLITPIGNTPYTYILNSMFGQSNFENALSIDYIQEMSALVPLKNLAFVVFSIITLSFLIFVPSKIKIEHLFLLLGLTIMALMSVRYCYLLVLLGAYPLTAIITSAVNLLISDDMTLLEKALIHPIAICILIFLSSIFTTSKILNKIEDSYVLTESYPIEAVNYIKNNLDYKNIKIFNSYNIGSYLMLNDIPVFIDSRLDVYCSEFNDTDIFKDFIHASYGIESYKGIFDKYNFSHVLLEKNSIVNQYIPSDADYNLLYEDDHFVLYEKNN